MWDYYRMHCQKLEDSLERFDTRSDGLDLPQPNRCLKFWSWYPFFHVFSWFERDTKRITAFFFGEGPIPKKGGTHKLDLTNGFYKFC